MFYASRFLTALSDLGGYINHPQKADEDAMFEVVKQSKQQGLKPAEAAISYFVTHAENGIAAEPEKWIPITRDAAIQARMWLNLKKVGQSYADMLVALLPRRQPDGAPESGQEGQQVGNA